MKNRLIQFHGSSSFHSLSQNIPFYQSTTTPLKPYLGKGICKISHSIALYNSAKIRTESGKTKRLYKTNRNCCYCLVTVRFSSYKSLSTPDFFLIVIKNTLMVSQRHSLDLEYYRTTCKTSQSNKVYLFTVIYAEKGQFFTFGI